ncbi:hypothetical protein PSECIP111951_01402 [Pseudoalteromonas holothuriae]|nr:hypothetical protein PSECIP111951_01402 [Pseudoalteromonas sp. CIP111951]
MKIITKLSKQDYLDYNRFLLGRVQKEHAKQKTMWVKNLLVWLVLVVVFYFVLQ